MTEEELKDELFRVGNINMELIYKLDEAEAIIEVYKKALELACVKVLERECNALCEGYTKCDNQICREGSLSEEINECLKKARGEEC